MSFRAPLVKKGSCGAFRNGCSDTARRRSDDVELYRQMVQDTRSEARRAVSYQIVNWRAFRLFVNVAYSLLNGG